MAWIRSTFLPATLGLPLKLSAMLGMRAEALRKLSGNWVVKDIGRSSPTECAAMRLMKPRSGNRAVPPPRRRIPAGPSSIVSLGFEMRAAGVVGAGKGHKSDLFFLPERIDRIL